MSKRKKWEPPAPAPGCMFVVVRVGNYGPIATADGGLSVSEDATLGDLHKELVDVVQTPLFLEKQYEAKLKAITVLCNRDQPILVGGEEKPDDTKLKDLGVHPTTFAYGSLVLGTEGAPVLELKVYAPVPTPEGIQEAANAQDVPDTVTTDDVKCVGNCGFFGRQSGYCSKCWSSADAGTRRFYTYAFHQMQGKRTEALELLGKAQGKLEEEQQKKAKVEHEKHLEQDKLRAARAKENAARKAAGTCYCVSSNLGSDWHIWSREDFAEGTPTCDFQLWSCGLRLAAHHDANPCPAESWRAMSELVEELAQKVSAAKEDTEATEQWSVFWVSMEEQRAAGASEEESVPLRLRRVLQLPDSVPYAEEEKLGWSRACFWDKENYTQPGKTAANLAKLKAATTRLKQVCVKDEVWRISFNPDEQAPCYPVFIVGASKEGGHLVCTWAKRVWT